MNVRENSLRTLVARGGIGRGLVCKLPSPDLVEIGGFCGFDFVVIDQEHSPIGIETLAQMVRAAECSGLPALVRLPGSDWPLLGSVLDLGPQGIIAPMVRDAKEVERFVHRLRYPPDGARGSSPTSRAAKYSLVPYGEATARLNREMLAWVIIETPDALANLEAIVAVPGVDVIWAGLFDLADALGTAPPSAQGLDPKLEAALGKIVAAGKRAGKAVMVWGGIPDRQGWIERGANLFYLGTDVSLFVGACREALAK